MHAPTKSEQKELIGSGRTTIKFNMFRLGEYKELIWK